MASKKEKELTVEVELRVLQLIVATMLAHQLLDEDDPAWAADRFMESINMSISTAKFSKVPVARRETLRQAMMRAADEIGQMARAPQLYPRLSEQAQ